MLTTEEQKDLVKRHQELLKAAHNVRALQDRYFKSRSSLALEEAKKAEKKLDDIIAREIKVQKTEQLKML